MKRTTRRIVAWLLAFVMVLGMVTGVVPGGKAVTAQAAGSTPVSMHGRLSVSGTQLVDQYGQPYQIHGVSTHGLQWFGQYNNKAAYQTLRDDWGANCIRLAMYVEEGGYMSNPTAMKNQVNAGVQYATELGMYAIIDWHILNGSTANPKNYTAQAKAFFAEMAQKYAGYNNVIYEICNEPNGCSWSDIKAYATEVIATIRQYDPNGIIIVGTPTWSQLGSAGHLTEPADDPIRGYSNLMYTFHFYASDASHNQWQTGKIATSISKGLPVFVTEFGLSEASGNGNVDLNKSTEWMTRCDQYNVSYCAWSLCNKNESSALISSNCSKTSGWSTGELTTAGNFVRNWYRNRSASDNYAINNPTVQNLAPGITVSYKTHVQSFGWQGYVSNGLMSGTSGLARRLEGIQIKVEGNPNLGIRYKTHVQSFGWQDWKYNDQMAGTEGLARRLEAICIELTGSDADKYDVYYRVHAQSFGWLDWAKNGEMSGTEGLGRRLEAINIVIVPKNADPGVPRTTTCVSPYAGQVNYRTHVQSFGWQNFVSDGAMSGTSGLARRLEGIEIQLNKNIDGGVMYQTHVQSFGWQDWRANGQMAGTEGLARRLEAIRIQLTGNAANQYDIYYRVHVQTFGWLDWAKNGEMSGTSGLARRLEGIEIRLVPKGGPAPGPTQNTCIAR